MGGWMAGGVALGGWGMVGRMAWAAGGGGGLKGELERIERESGGRLGVAVLDVTSGEMAGHREGERFAMCSTSKVMSVSAVLARVDAGKEDLERVVRYGKGELLEYSPVTERHVGEGMTLGELCEAAVTMSDNAAQNLILAALGGPGSVTEFVRGLGDPVTRFDRTEPTLNTAVPGDPRDTTEPAAMARDLQRLVLGDALSVGSRQRLREWMLGCTTGDRRLRAGLPAGWRVADKTGSGDNGTTNDVAVVWPPIGGAMVVTAYLTGSAKGRDAGEATLAAVGRAVARAAGGEG